MISMPGLARAVAIAAMLAAAMPAGVGTAAAQEADGAERWQAVIEEVVRLHGEGAFAEALAMAREAAELAETVFGPDGVETSVSLNNLGSLLALTGALAESEPYFRRTLAIREAVLGPDHAETGAAAANLAQVLSGLDRPGEAALAYAQVVPSLEAAHGPGHPDLEPHLRHVGALFQEAGDYAAAEPWLRRILAIHEETLGPDHVTTAVSLNNLALVLQELDRNAEAEQLLRRALAIDLVALAADDPDLALAHGNLADVLSFTGQYEEAEENYRAALAIREVAFGPDDPLTAVSLNNLGLLLWSTGRPAAAEPLHRRALAIREAAFGPDASETAQSINNLGLALVDQGDYEAAVPLYRRALAISEATLGPDHPDTSKAINNLAQALEMAGDYGQAVELFRKALAIDEETSGPNHPNTAIALNNLADTLARGSDVLSLLEAQALHMRALSIREALFGDEHPETAQSLDNLALLLSRMSDHAGARRLLERAVAVHSSPAHRSRVRQYDHVFVAAAANLLSLREPEPDTAFEPVQWPIGGAAGAAMASTAARLAAGEPELARLVRERQNLEGEHGRVGAAILAAHGSDTPAAALALREEAAALSDAIARLDEELAERFPQFAELGGGEPLPAQAVADLLRPGEAMVVLVPGHYRTAGDAIPGSAFVVRWDGRVEGALLEAGTQLQRDALRLRCNVSGEGADCAGAQEPAYGEPEMVERGAVSLAGGGARPGGFDLDLAHDLYARTLGRVAHALDRVDHLMLVTGDDSLSGLPFQMLLTEKPDAGGDAPDGLRTAPWLIRDYAVTSLPAVASLRALRELAPRTAPAPKAFLGVGDPVIGRGGPMVCAEPQVLLAAGEQEAEPDIYLRAVDGDTAQLLLAGGTGSDVVIADVEAVRALARLPDTRCELEEIAASLGEGDLLLEEEATETRLKAMSAAGTLQDYRIISFATHGLVAGEAGGAEPALVLTPPLQGSAEDDGLLTASEVAALELNAEWVLLSACNTAAGSGGGESLSGLARAFFYAGARTLLVSHWPVASPAAVRLTTSSMARLNLDPQLGRAEALRQAMLEILDDPASRPWELHPRYWAPFSLVGEGG